MSDSTSIFLSPSSSPGMVAGPGLRDSSWKAMAIEFWGEVGEIGEYQVNMAYNVIDDNKHKCEQGKVPETLLRTF